VAFRTAEVVASMDAVSPVAAPISIDGGMTRNGWFCQFLADALGREVVVSDEPELTALGTAMLAAEGMGRRIDRAATGTRLAPRPMPDDWAATFAAARDAVQRYGARG
jgi:glycerol kinase